LAVHVISYPASQNQVGGARVTAGSGVHRGWPRIYGYPLFCNTVFDAVFGLLSSIRRLSGVVAPRLDENRCPTILISGTAFQPCGSSGLSSGRLAVHVISYPASQNQVGGARVTAGSGVHRGWPRIEFSVMGRNCPGDSCQLVGQRADHEIGVMAGR